MTRVDLRIPMAEAVNSKLKEQLERRLRKATAAKANATVHAAAFVDNMRPAGGPGGRRPRH